MNNGLFHGWVAHELHGFLHSIQSEGFERPPFLTLTLKIKEAEQILLGQIFVVSFQDETDNLLKTLRGWQAISFDQLTGESPSVQ